MFLRRFKDEASDIVHANNVVVQEQYMWMSVTVCEIGWLLEEMLTICFGWALSFLNFLWLEPSNFVGFEACHFLRIWYWHIPLTTGSTCVVWPTWQNQDISQLMQYFRRHRWGVLSRFKLERTLFFKKTFSSTCVFFSLSLSLSSDTHLFGVLP